MGYFKQQARRLKSEYDALFEFVKTHKAIMTADEKADARHELEMLSDRLADAQRAAALEKD
ncbi:hypothetical protein [Nonomuraea basaltis]|uniref:hypothetical protein n=1 Tax=Nonomuraea basaltis TaxID=2495887 RepID=UPI00110C4B3E|nr:hypothetical protein [Nonomuraea basaltis]TMS00209.1 hypothetical protein EJK15_03800 [Nonomuraea basaltis]